MTAQSTDDLQNELLTADIADKTAPEHKVFIDGCGDVYDWTGVFGEFGAWATLQQDPQRLLDKYRIDFCLLSREAPMGRVLPLLPGWKLVYSDALSSVFVRSGA